jgi:hypothetical protein
MRADNATIKKPTRNNRKRTPLVVEEVKNSGEATPAPGVRLTKVDFESDKYVFAKKKSGYSGCT